MTTEYLLSRKEVEKRVGLSRSTIYDHMNAGTFPRPVRVGPKAVRWRTSEIDAWMDNLPVATGEVGMQR